MKVILIDPIAREIKEIEVGEERMGIDAIYKAIDCDCITQAIIDETTILVVDDEGLYDPKAMFLFEGYMQPLANKALVVSPLHDDWTSPFLTVDEVKARVKWVHPDHIAEIADKLLGMSPIFIPI